MQFIESELAVDRFGLSLLLSLVVGSENRVAVVDGGLRLSGTVGVVLKSMLPVRPSNPRAASVASFTIVIASERVVVATARDK